MMSREADKKKMVSLGCSSLVKLVCVIISLSLVISAEEDDTAIMNRLASMLSPTPSSWNTSIHPCNWSYSITCDASFRVNRIDISHFYLSGTLPSILNSLSHLTYLNLDYNHLSGSFPSLANLRLLRYIIIDSNNFTSIPDDAFSGLTSLETLSLNDNSKLTSWTIPSELAQSRLLSTLRASRANLGGSIPDIFSSLPSLQELDLSFNHLSGSLPPSLTQTSLQSLLLSNQTIGLSGPIDLLANMTSLEIVMLDGNKFTGPIPDLSDCKSLKVLQVENNQLQGPVPVFKNNVNITLGGVRGNSFCKNKPGPCDHQVMTLLQVVGALGYPVEVAEAWKGNNACEQWKFIKCDSSGRVSSIDFARQGFQGTISSAFGNLTNLIELHLNDNYLTGTIPESLTRLTNLRTLDLSNNNILPPQPKFASSVNVMISGNSKLLKSPAVKASPKRKSSIKMILLILFGAIVGLIAAICTVLLLYRRNKHLIKQQKEAQELENSLKMLADNPVRFTYEVLRVATSNFDKQRKLGGGGFGTVFEGILIDGTKVAVKRLDHFNQGMKEFLAEVRTVGSIQHLNLVRLIGFCAEKTYRLLVYEYMSNGSLDRWIFHNDEGESLSWDARKRIILHITKGLAYLHEDCMKKIAHLDVKPQNVLLDQGFNAKLSDFGLAKLIDRDQSFVMTQMRGTRGYLAPEWLDRKITEKADVYSYGVVVLEIVFERKNLDSCPSEESDNRLIHIVRMKVETNQLYGLLDNCSEEMKQNGEDVERIIKLALWCLDRDPRIRPSMSMVVKILEGAESMDFINDHVLLPFPTEANATKDDITQVSDCLLSGPR